MQADDARERTDVGRREAGHEEGLHRGQKVLRARVGSVQLGPLAGATSVPLVLVRGEEQLYLERRERRCLVDEGRAEDCAAPRWKSRYVTSRVSEARIWPNMSTKGMYALSKQYAMNAARRLDSSSRQAYHRISTSSPSATVLVRTLKSALRLYMVRKEG
jgi:hypothetical protein